MDSTLRIIQPPSGDHHFVHHPRDPLSAVIIGMGPAGLGAALCLTKLGFRVHVVERDTLRDAGADPAPTPSQVLGEGRSGVPQYRQPHVFLAESYVALKNLGIDMHTALLHAGGILINSLVDNMSVEGGEVFPRTPLNSTTAQCVGICATRHKFETVLRQQVLAKCPGIELTSGGTVKGLLLSNDRTAVTGLVLKSGVTMDTHLVVDASGRHSRLPQWLSDEGFEVPPAETVNSKLGYATRMYHIPEWNKDYKMAVNFSSDSGTRNGMIWPVEGDHVYMVALSGYLGDHPPTTEAAFLEFAASLEKVFEHGCAQAGDIYELIKDATPLTPVIAYKNTENRRRHFEKVEMPDGLVALGDSVLSLNPVHGQGITVSMMGAELLHDVLAKRLAATSSTSNRALALRGLAKEFQTKLARQHRTPWILATDSDRKRMGEDTLAGVNFMQRMIAAYFVFLRRVARSDTAVHYSIWRLFHHLDSLEQALFNPVLLFRALSFWFKLKMYAMFGHDPELHSKKPAAVRVDVHLNGHEKKAAKAS